ncbi:hypothetical protein HNV12_02485 [Methanococcoides sp. SA1]|nr:hypothetical protein [Methanococcoides sp. SA1]
MVRKNIFIGSIIAVLFLVLGFLFVFGDDILSVTKESVSQKENFGDKGKVDEGGVNTLSGGIGDVFLIENNGSNETFVEVICGTQPVQYSLKNFVEDVNCLSGTDLECTQAVINCSVEIYNFDLSVDDLFAIEFSLVDSEEVKLESNIIERVVGIGAFEILVSEFIYEGNFDVNDLGCGVAMERIPRKCV